MRRFGVATVAALVLCAGRADAQFDHRLGATTGGGCAAETTEDLDVDSVSNSCGTGVAGVDANWFQNDASADSATGHLTISSLLGYEDSPGSFDPDSLDTLASIQERLTRTEVGPIRATLQLSAGLQQAKAVVRWEATLRLTNACSAFVSQYVGNGFTEDPDLITSCPFDGSATADLNTLTVTFDAPTTTIDLLAQVRAEYFNFGLYDLTSGEYEIAANLLIGPLEGADYTAP